jgi:transposase
MWVPPEEKDPTVLLAPTRKSISLFGAVNVKDGRLITRFEKIFDAMTFKNFLMQLLRTRKSGKKVVVILDNAKYHHAKLLKPLLGKYRATLKLEFLPAYSPELNPVERVWKLTRKICTHNVHFEKLDQLKAVVQNQHYRWRKPNSTLARLCCIT